MGAPERHSRVSREGRFVPGVKGKNMAKKYVLAATGSPRKDGNSETLCDRVLAGAESAGARVEKFNLYDMDIKPCTACGKCQEDKSGMCVIKDDMRQLYPRLKKCDGLVLASPIYWMMVSGPMKIFIDRWYALHVGSKSFLGAKRAVVCLAYGADDVLLSGCDMAARSLNDVFTYLNVPAHFVHASAWNKGDIKSNKEALKRAFAAGKQLISPSKS
jgi:multimeric flavodoxin WrbA